MDNAELQTTLDKMTDENVFPWEDTDYCPECGCHWFIHNDDGSCVED